MRKISFILILFIYLLGRAQHQSFTTQYQLSFASESLRIANIAPPNGTICIVKSTGSQYIYIENNWIAYNVIPSYVTNTQSSNNTTLTNIIGLSDTLYAGHSYQFDLKLLCQTATQAAALGGFKFDMAGGSVVASKVTFNTNISATSNLGIQCQGTSLTSVCGNYYPGVSLVFIVGVITVATSGTIIPRFAQNVTNVVASQVLFGSTMILRQIL